MNFKTNFCILFTLLILKSVNCFNEPENKIKFLKNEKIESLQNFNPQHLTPQSNPPQQPAQNHLLSQQKQDNLPSQLHTNQSVQLSQPQPNNLISQQHNSHFPQQSSHPIQQQSSHPIQQQQPNQFAPQQPNPLQTQSLPQPDNHLTQQNNFPQQNTILEGSILDPSKKNSNSLIDNDNDSQNSNIKGRTLGLGSVISCDLNNSTEKMSNSSIENSNQDNGICDKKNLLNNQLETTLIDQNKLKNNYSLNENYEKNYLKLNTSSNQLEKNQFNLSQSVQYLIEKNISLPIVFNKDYSLTSYADPVYVNKKLLAINKTKDRNNDNNKFRSLIIDNNEKPNNNLSSNFLIAKLSFIGQIKSAKLGIISSIFGLNSFGVKESLTSTTCSYNGIDTFLSSSSLKISLLCMTTVCIPSMSVDIINNNEYVQCSLSCLTDPKSAVALFVYKNYNSLTEILNFKKQTINNLQSTLTTDLVVEGY